MDKTIIKRNGSIVPFDKLKIAKAIERAFLSVDKTIDQEAVEYGDRIANNIEENWEPDLTVENVQDMVETQLMSGHRKDVAQAYIRYRYEHALAREKYSELIDAVQEKLEASNVQNQNANIDEHSFGGRMGEMGSAVATTYALDYIMSPKAKYNHQNNRIYTHDLNSYAVGMHNCLTLPLDDLFANGFNTRQTDIRAPKSVSTAFQLLAVTFQTQSLCQFGGVASGHIDWTMVPYVRMSFYKHYKDGIKYIDTFASIPEFDVNRSIDDNVYKRHSKAYQYALDMTTREVHQSVEGAYHNLNSLQSRSGNQLPFSSLNYGTCTLPEGRMVTKAILECSLEGTGALHRTPIFPCGIFTMKKGVNYPGDPNYDLFKLALKSTAKRLYPNYGNGDWSAQKVWVKYDRDRKQEVLNELSDEEYKKLYDIVAENEKIADFLMLTPSMGKLYVDQKEKPGEVFATMGK